ncbi:MAG: carotenoid biosynthesis protein [Anaerolineales bacterium]|nr:carotenoid biosynthesis protein [Anaerolineales bacterium]
MNNDHQGHAPFVYLAMVTLIAISLIVLNDLLHWHLPFSVDYLIGYVCALFVFVAWHAIITKGWQRAVLMLTASFIISFTAEALGVNFGLIFGSYHYTAVLGVQIFGVPLLAALAWEPIVYAAFCITDILAPSQATYHKNWIKRLPLHLWLAGIGSLATTAWDMMIDPIAVNEGWWVWHEGGSYMPYLNNGVPIQNFLGWLGVSFVINLIYRFIYDTVKTPVRSLHLSITGPITLYASLFMTSFGVAVTVLRRPEVALTGMLAMGPFLLIALTNINLLQKGLATLLGAGWLEVQERKSLGD